MVHCAAGLRPGQGINAACHKLGFSLNKKYLKESGGEML